MSDCIFCKIVKGDIPCNKVYEDKDFLAFHDLHPKAKAHALVIPKKHIDSLNKLMDDDEILMGKLTLLIPKIADMLGQSKGFQTRIHTEKSGGQEVFHLHYHILGNH